MKNVLIGITGSIAAYKTAELIRLFVKEGCDVKVVASESALLFIGEKTIETLTSNPCYVDMFEKHYETKHISLADWADVFVVAPITANTIAKAAYGLADNLISSIICAYMGKNKPIFMAPAMNEGMWDNPVTKENIAKLKSFNVKIIEPALGYLACGANGKGRLEEPENIFNFVKNELREKKGKKIVITAGGTKEYIDPVRFISNSSSGKTGMALADAAYESGYDVTLITTVKCNKPYKTVNVETALDMLNAVNAEFQDADYLFMASAVCDFNVKNPKNEKILKKEINNDSYTVELGLNPDILKNVAQNKKEGQKIIGFCLATSNLKEYAIEKLKNKNSDYVVANYASALNADESEVWVIDKNENIQKIEKAPKKDVAKAILEIVL